MNEQEESKQEGDPGQEMDLVMGAKRKTRALNPAYKL